jgi:hypothetical protein
MQSRLIKRRERNYQKHNCGAGKNQGAGAHRGAFATTRIRIQRMDAEHRRGEVVQVRNHGGRNGVYGSMAHVGVFEPADERQRGPGDHKEQQGVRPGIGTGEHHGLRAGENHNRGERGFALSKRRYARRYKRTDPKQIAMRDGSRRTYSRTAPGL